MSLWRVRRSRMFPERWMAYRRNKIYTAKYFDSWRAAMDYATERSGHHDMGQ